MIELSWIKKSILLAVILPAPLFAQSIQAFTTSTQPFTDIVPAATVCYVDQAQILMNKIVAETKGSTPQTLMNQLNHQDLEALSDVITCSYQAALMGVQKVPAVVVDKKYVVYGNTDMTGAVAEVHNAVHS